MTAFLVMWIGSLRCDFVKFTDTSGTSPDPVSLQFGMWRYLFYSLVANVDGLYVFESCHGYPDYQEIDPTWKTAQAFSILAFIFGLFALIFSCIFACTIDSDDNFARSSWFAPGLYLTTGLFQGLSLLLLSSNACKNNAIVKLAAQTTYATFPETCSMNTGAKLIISATAFWLAAAFVSFAARKVDLIGEEVDKAFEKGDEVNKASEKGEDVEAADTEEKVEQAKPEEVAA